MAESRWPDAGRSDSRSVDTTLQVLLAVAILGGLVGAAVAVVASGTSLPEFGVATGSASPTADTASPGDPSPWPTGGSAGSSGFVEEFDALPIGTEADAWALTGDAALTVSGQPTAVDRSIRLAAETQGTACRPINVPLGTLNADFMLDALPSDTVQVLALEFDGAPTIGVTVTSSEVTLTDASAGVTIDARAWYRWSVVAVGDEFEISLVGADGSPLTEARVPAPEHHPTRFCVTALSPARAHLDSLSVEAP